MKFLVTGGAGFIGSHIVEELINYGEVTVIDNLSTGKVENITSILDKGTLIESDILDYDEVLRAMKNVDYVFHEAALVSVIGSIKNPIMANEINVKGTLNVLEAANKNSVKKVIFASSSSIYGNIDVLPIKESMKPDPISPYALTKYTAETYCRLYSYLYGVPTVCLRYFNVYGPRQDPSSEYSAVIPKFLSLILNRKEPTIFGDGTQSRDFVYVKDIVDANLQAMRTDIEGIFNIASGKSITLNELFKKMLLSTGIDISPTYQQARPGDVKHSLADITEARTELGFNPKYNIDFGLRETANWLRDSMSL